MEYTTLQFPSTKELWLFIKKANLKNYEFDMQAYTLRALLTEDQIWIALTEAHAVVKERQKTA